MRSMKTGGLDHRRIWRLLKPALLVVLACAMVSVGLPWLHAGYVRLPRWLTRMLTIGFLQAVRLAYGVSLATAPLLVAACAVRLSRARRGRFRTVWPGRLLVLALAILIGWAVLEAGAVLYQASQQRLPILPTTFSQPPASPNEIHLVVIGESSALGTPFDPWLSVGQIVAWELERVFPGRRVTVEMKAAGGICLEQAILTLKNVAQRPDAVLIYAGHNEFQARFGWSRFVRHYADDAPRHPARLVQWSSRLSPLCRLIAETIEQNRVDDAPLPKATRALVDRPAFLPEEYALLRSEFHRRLEGVVAYCEAIGALPMLIVPSGNEGGFAPIRSYLALDVPRAERDRVASAFRRARALEARAPVEAEAAYRAILGAHPTFAEAHFRLGRLRCQAGDRAAANRHFGLARDLDGMPMRCPSDFLAAYRIVAGRHHAVLVDGPEVLRRLAPTGILDESVIQDAQHPTFRGYLALAQALLEQLRARRAFGWPDATPLPVIDPAECAARFAMGPARWAEVCNRTSFFYTETAFMRHDPQENLAWARRYHDAAPRISNGEDPASVGIPGLGVQPPGLRRGAASLTRQYPRSRDPDERQ